MADPNPFSKVVYRELYGHKKKVHTLDWNCNGKKLATGSKDFTLRIWNLDGLPSSNFRDKSELELKGHTDSADILKWDPRHPDKLASASADKTVRFWDVRTNKCTGLVHTVGENINVAWSPDSQVLAVGNRDDHMQIIDVRKMRVVKNTKFTYEVNEIQFNKDGDLLYVTSGIGTLDVLTYPELSRIYTLNGHTASVFCLSSDPTGRYLALGGADALTSLWDTRDLVCVKTFSRLEAPIRAVSFSHDGQYLASGGLDLLIDISHVQSNTTVHQIPCRGITNSLAWNPCHRVLAVAGDTDDRTEGVTRLMIA